MIDHHPGDALSALLDGELDAAEAAAVAAHVAGCAECGAELGEIRAARRVLRELPAVEPPPGFLASLQPGSNVVPIGRHRARRLGNLAAAAAAAVSAIALLGSTPSVDVGVAVAAEPQGAADRHDATVSATSAGAGGVGLVLPDRRVSPTTTPSQGLDDLPPGYVAPTELAGYRLVGAYRMADGVHLLYEKGRHRLSVFEQEGDLGDLPANLRRVGDVWQWDDPRVGGRVVVAEHDGMVITIVGDESPEAVLEAMEAMPRPGGGEPFARRLRRACGDVLESLSPAG